MHWRHGVLLVALGGHLAAAIAQQPGVDGRQLFQTKCALCHLVTRDGGHSAGSGLHGVVGRQIGSAPGYHYSEAMHSRAGEIWTVNALDAFIALPRKFMPRTAMSFPGLANEAQRKLLIEYLESLN